MFTSQINTNHNIYKYVHLYIIEVFDFETIKKDNKIIPYCISYSEGDNFYNHKFSLKEEHEALQFILQHFKKDKIYYAHNLIFDFFCIFQSVLLLQIKYNWVYINYNLYEVCVGEKNNKITLRCSYKLLPFSLKSFYPQLSKIQKLNFPYETLDNWEPQTLCCNYSIINEEYKQLTLGEYIVIYNIFDVKILKEGLINCIKTLKQNNIQFSNKTLSISSVALNFYKKNWSDLNLKLDKKYKNLLRAAYFGGRCEVFGNKQENEKILHFDFRGMYQQCMLESVPYDTFETKIKNLDLNIPGFYYIAAKVNHQFPILPIRNSKLFFKNGKILGLYWHEEILFAQKNKQFEDLQIFYGHISTKNGPVLSKFINKLNILCDKGGVFKKIGKLLINSFYGRLGLQDEMHIMSISHMNIADDYKTLLNVILSKKTIKPNSNSNIAVAASITSKARIKLYEAFQDVWDNTGRILYCDTDSVFAAFDKNKHVEDKLLGKHVFFNTSNELTSIKDAVFIGSKTYGIILKNNKKFIKIKGVTEPQISFEDLKKKFYENVESIQQITPVFKKRDCQINVDHTIKIISLNSYNKRLWFDNKTNTKPLNND